MSKSLLLKPRVSEKSYDQSQSLNVYTFDVPVTANKLTVKQAVSAQFDVTVISVNIANSKGKVKRTIRRGGRVTMGKRSNSRKAYVTLKAGESIPIFAAVEEDAAKSKEAEAKKPSRTTRIKKGEK